MTPHQKSRSACLIVSRAADNDTPEGKLWTAVVHTVIQDFFFWPMVDRRDAGTLVHQRRRPKKERIHRYMQTRDFERVCGYAGLHPEFVEEVIARLELHESPEL